MLNDRAKGLASSSAKDGNCNTQELLRENIRHVGDDAELDLTTPLISPAIFCSVFPFHVLFNRSLHVEQAGASISRLIPSTCSSTKRVHKLTDLFNITLPNISTVSYDEIMNHADSCFVLETVTTKEGNRKIFLKGQMLCLPDYDCVYFLCSPRLETLDDLDKNGLYLSDIPIHDATRDFVLLSEQSEAESKLAQKLQNLNKQLEETYRELEEEKLRYDRLMYSVLPPSVANELRHHRQVSAQKFSCVTVMFTGISGFTEFCARHSGHGGAMKVVDLLNSMFTTFDDLIDLEKHSNIYKVETAGDKYMTVSGLPVTCQDHARCIARLALDMMAVPNQLKSSHREGPITLTVGIHSGDVVAGVIGKKLPRYCLFGNTVNLCSRTETTGILNKVNISEDTYRCLQEPECFDDNFHFEYRGLVNMKGRKDPMNCWFLSSKRANDTA